MNVKMMNNLVNLFPGFQHRYLPEDVAAYVNRVTASAGVFIRGGCKEGAGWKLRLPDGVYHAGPSGAEGLQLDADRWTIGL